MFVFRLIWPLILALTRQTHARGLPVRASAPSVNISYATVVGSSAGGIDSFLGIPFAQTPVGNLRFEPPQSINSSLGTIQATSQPKACPQALNILQALNLPQNLTVPVSEAISYLGGSTNATQSEDCLYLNVIRPAGTDANAKLPVVIWIFGGAFQFGDVSSYPGNNVVVQSVRMNQPVIYVAMNYRVGIFGFLPGPEVAATGSGNWGLLDQRLAMQWVNQHIAAFGGDPTKVTLWGESAGSISIGFHLIANGGNNEGLFRGAIMESGSAYHALNLSTDTRAIDFISQQTGCQSPPAGQNRLQCLKALPYQKLQAANFAMPGLLSYQGVNLWTAPRYGGDYIPTLWLDAYGSGQYVKNANILIGDNDDEGTLLVLGTSTNMTTPSDFNSFVGNILIPGASASVINEIDTLYPDDPTQGSPYGTGYLDQLTPESKRLASLFGDVTFQAPRRALLSYASKTQDTYSYLYKADKAIPFLGSFHALEIANTFGIVPGSLTTEMMSRWISFINNQSPNTGLYQGWPKYDTSSKPLLLFEDTGSLGTTPDTYREQQTQYLITI